MRVLITGGGTAGHVNPALAIADIIKEKEPDSVIEYVGTEYGIEGKLVPKRGMKMHSITVKGLSRSLSPSNLKALYLAFSARIACKKIIREFKPDVVIGTGGYVCWPLISAASAMKIPSVLHESNAEPGFAVKTLQSKADLILVNFEGTKKYLHKAKAKIERVGMPVNQEFYASVTLKPLVHLGNDVNTVQKMPKSASEGNRGKIRILSFGGSLGAQTVNQCALRLMKDFVVTHPNVTIEHASGSRSYATVKAEFDALALNTAENITLSEYIYDMPKKMAQADLVICRSGASTLAELAVAGKASILIPSPNVTGDQQRKNAAQLFEAQAAEVLEDSAACDNIVETVSALLGKEGRLAELSRNVRAFALDDCNDRIYNAIKLLTKK